MPVVVIVIFVCAFFGVMLHQSVSNDLTNEQKEKFSVVSYNNRP